MDLAGTWGVRTTKYPTVLGGEPGPVVENFVERGDGGDARAHRTCRAAVVCEGEVLDVLEGRVLERLGHEGVYRQAV